MKVHKQNNQYIVPAEQLEVMQVGRITEGRHANELVMMGKSGMLYCLTDGDYWEKGCYGFTVEIIPSGSLLEI